MRGLPAYSLFWGPFFAALRPFTCPIGRGHFTRPLFGVPRMLVIFRVVWRTVRMI